MYKNSLVLAAILLLAVTGSARAATATISEFASFSTQDGVNSGANGAFFNDSLFASDFVSFGRFNPALGDLLSVELIVSGTASLGASANFRDDDFFSRTAGSIGTSGLALSYNLPGFGLLQHNFFNPSSTCSDTSGFGSSSCSAGIGFSGSSFGATRSSSNSTLLLNYIGLGSLGISFNQLGNLITRETDGDNGYVNFRSGNFATSGTLKINYNYSVVPVPAAAWLFGSALLGLLGYQRRKMRG